MRSHPPVHEPSGVSAPSYRASSRGASVAQWAIAFMLGVIATLLFLRPVGPSLPTALAQGQTPAGARGVYAFTGQLDANRYGLFMLDVDQGTVWCYELGESGNTLKMKLVAARTWVYDRFLQDFNNEKPDFRMVQELVAQQRANNTGTKPNRGDGEPEKSP